MLRLCHFVKLSPQPGDDKTGTVPSSTSSRTLTWQGPDVKVTLGRCESCDVRIAGETVSRLHCEIERIGRIYHLRDRSRNGTWVNETRVDECQLQNGDWIQVGEDHLRVDLVPFDKATDRLVVRRTVDPTSDLQPYTGRAPRQELGSVPNQSGNVPRGLNSQSLREELSEGQPGQSSPWKTGIVLPYQMVIRGLEAGVTLQFWDSRITFGRWKATEVVLAGEKISRIHAALTREESSYVLVDLESTNGTFVNDQRITRCVLQSGDRIRMGSYLALVRLDQGDCLLHFQRLQP